MLARQKRRALNFCVRWVFYTVMRKSIFFMFLSCLAFTTSQALAQQGLKTPQPSPAATVTQAVGLTELTVSYHRPSVNGRKIWGELVPYGEVWRAGANENTTFTTSSPVKINGKSLPAGTYGLHMIPSAPDSKKEWTLIVSRTATAWGSYGYDQKEDALRVPLAAQPSEAFEERLSFRFDDPTDMSTVLTLRWEKLKLPIKIDVDTPQVTMAAMRAELRGVQQFVWQSWNQAAQYWLTHGGNLDEALRMADRSIGRNENFQNVMTRAQILEKKGDTKAANLLRDKAMTLASSENDVNLYGYLLLQEKKIDEAIVVFQKNVKDHPSSWNVHDSLGEALLAKGDRKAAADSYAKALTLVKDDANKKRIEQTLTKLKSK
jgi:TolA-binding protein